MKLTLEIIITKVRIITLINKIETRTIIIISATALASQELNTISITTTMEQLQQHQKQLPGQANQCGSDPHWTSQQGPAVQDSGSSQTSITIQMS